MKKIALLFVSILCVSVLSAAAQGLVVKAGYNYSSSASVKVSDLKTGRSGWQVGVGYQTETTRGFSFQPEALYKVAGLKFSDGADLRLSYVEVPINVQWGPDLLVCRPFVFAGPYVGYRFKPTVNGLSDAEVSALKKFEWGVGAGIGIDVWKLQIAGKYNWNFGTFADIESAQQALSHFDNITGHIRTFEISVGLKF